MSLARDIDFDPTRPLPEFLTKGQNIGPAAVRERPKGPPAETALLEDFARELSRDRLDEIASAIRVLTYGEMMELAEAIWKTKPESDITQDALPMMLHKWSGSRQ